MTNNTTAILRKLSAEILVTLTIAERKRVKKVKLSTKPVTIPSGLLFPPVSELERTIGNTGRIQGEKIVMIPLKKANKTRIIIVLKYISKS